MMEFENITYAELDVKINKINLLEKNGRLTKDEAGYHRQKSKNEVLHKLQDYYDILNGNPMLEHYDKIDIDQSHTPAVNFLNYIHVTFLEGDTVELDKVYQLIDNLPKQRSGFDQITADALQELIAYHYNTISGYKAHE